MNTSTWESLELYDPTEEHSELRLQLLEYLTSLGANTDELLAYRDALPALAMVLAVRGSWPASEIAAAVGTPH